MNHDYPSAGPFTDEQSESLLDDLEVRCSTGVGTARDLAARRTRARILVRPANASERGQSVTEMHTSEVAKHHALGLATRPAMVGNVFHLEFDRATLNVAPTLALCDRCTMLGDASFELRFRFVQPIDLDRETPQTP